MTTLWNLSETSVTYDNPVYLWDGTLASMRVQAVTTGWYAGQLYEPGDVFDLVSAADYSPANTNYAGPNAGTQQYGWMLAVPNTTPLLEQRIAQPIPLFPLIDPVPPKRFVY